MPVGRAWVTSLVNKAPLSGIAHGCAGICLALAKLYDATEDDRYLQACLDGIRYENSLYSAGENNWKDLRFTEGSMPDNHYVMYWCNGAPGIGIARIGTNRYCPADAVMEDVRNAVDKTLRHGFTEVSYSLCHGDLGNLELIMLGADCLDDRNLKSYVHMMANHILQNVKRNGMHWKCGIPGRQQIPGLMLGLAGIGYQLLRLYNPDLPSVLLLDGPGEAANPQNKNTAKEYYNV